MKEIWKDVKGYEGLYQVSNLGRVRNAKTLRLKKLETRYDEYLFVRFHNNGYSGIRSVHRLVAETFVENKDLKDFLKDKGLIDEFGKVIDVE